VRIAFERHCGLKADQYSIIHTSTVPTAAAIMSCRHCATFSSRLSLCRCCGFAKRQTLDLPAVGPIPCTTLKSWLFCRPTLSTETNIVGSNGTSEAIHYSHSVASCLHSDKHQMTIKVRRLSCYTTQTRKMYFYHSFIPIPIDVLTERINSTCNNSHIMVV